VNAVDYKGKKRGDLSTAGGGGSSHLTQIRGGKGRISRPNIGEKSDQLFQDKRGVSFSQEGGEEGGGGRGRLQAHPHPRNVTQMGGGTEPVLSNVKGGKKKGPAVGVRPGGPPPARE